VNTVSGGEDGTGTLVETAVGNVVAMSTPTISSSIGLVVPVVLLDLRLLDLERAASTPKHIIELITPKVQVKVSKFHQKDIDIVTTHKLVNHKVNHTCTKKHPKSKRSKNQRAILTQNGDHLFCVKIRNVEKHNQTYQNKTWFGQRKLI